MNKATSVSARKVNVYAANDDTIGDVVPLEEARRLRDDGKACFINSGRDIRLIRPVDDVPDGREMIGVPRIADRSSICPSPFVRESYKTQTEIIGFMQLEKLAARTSKVRVTTRQLQ